MSEEKECIASCSCMGVEFSPIRNEDGSYTERWACKDCGNEFVKKVFLKSLESRLKEAERKRQCSEHHVKEQENTNDELSDENEALKTRLSQAEADLQDKAVSYCNGEILQLRTRLSNLMNVAGRMSSVLEEGQHMILRSLDSADDDEHEFLEKAKKVSAEWDVIKNEGV